MWLTLVESRRVELEAEVRITGMPASVASVAATTLVIAPPVPYPVDVPDTSRPDRLSPNWTKFIRSAPGSVGGFV